MWFCFLGHRINKCIFHTNDYYTYVNAAVHHGFVLCDCILVCVVFCCFFFIVSTSVINLLSRLQLQNTYSKSSETLNCITHLLKWCLLCRRLCRYFDGRHHLEEMMFYENIRRSQLLIILDKFYEILIISHHEEPNISYWLYSWPATAELELQGQCTLTLIFKVKVKCRSEGHTIYCV